MYAVKLYLHVSNKPAGIPDGWPAEVIDVGEVQSLPEQYDPEDGWSLMSEQELSTQKTNNQSAYNTWYTSYKNPISGIVDKSLSKAQAAGQQFMKEFAIENVLLGITQAGKTRAVTDSLHKFIHYLETGSLYAAIEQVDALISAGLDETLEPFVTEERMVLYKHKIQDYLGIPNT